MPKGKIGSGCIKKGKGKSQAKGATRGRPKGALRQQTDAALVEMDQPVTPAVAAEAITTPVVPLDPLSKIKELLKKQEFIHPKSSGGSDCHLFSSSDERCSKCGNFEEEVELSSEGRIFLSYCYWESEEEWGPATRHRRIQRREIVWFPDKRGFFFSPDFLDKLFDPIFEVAAVAIGSVASVANVVGKGVFSFMDCKCSSPDPDYKHPYHDDLGGYSCMCRRCGMWVN